VVLLISFVLERTLIPLEKQRDTLLYFIYGYVGQRYLSCYILTDCAMAQAVSRRPLIAEARVRSRFSLCGMFWWTKCYRDRFFSEYFGFPLSISFHCCSINMEKQRKPLHLHHRVAQYAIKAAVLPKLLLRSFSINK
jgi:hypothetical protein